MRTLSLAAALSGLLVSVAAATAIVERTELVSSSADGTIADGPSSRPALSGSGRVVVFESEASNLTDDPNGHLRDVFRRDLDTGAVTLVSSGPGGAPANGASDEPAVDARGETIVFTSRATDMVGGDTNNARDVFVRRGSGPVERVSVTSRGQQANGPSLQPDVSSDGRRVVFTSLADNLVGGDTNGVEDVFVRDLESGRTIRVSALAGRQFKGRSRAPSISAEGRWVTFESTASDVVPGDDNGVPDVFLADLEDGSVERVSVGDREQEQNSAVQLPFVTVSGVSRGGRYVVWDSDATNLVRGDRNRDTDVFVRDRKARRTWLVSRSATTRIGDNDSYFPSISDDGRFVSFNSFAGNLWPEDRAGEDLFVHDRYLHTTSPLTVRSRGGRRGPETARQLLRRAPLSADGRFAAFTSTARLVESDHNRLEDVLARDLAAPSGRFLRGPGRVARRGSRPRYRVAADDPAARFVCRLDRRRPYFCPASGRLPRLARGRHRFSVRAGGPGMQFDRTVAARTIRVR